jgi:hypothetical protein
MSKGQTLKASCRAYEIAARLQRVAAMTPSIVGFHALETFAGGGPPSAAIVETGRP